MNENRTLDSQEKGVDEEVEKLIQSLPKASFMGTKLQLIEYQGFWCVSSSLKKILMFQTHFHAQDTDLIIASYTKTGTTWLKALLFSVANRDKYPINQSPLCKKLPHELVYCIETDVYGNTSNYPRPNDLDELPSPRLFSTHMPYVSLPQSIKDSACKVIYISRNPMDTLVSLWHWTSSLMKNTLGPDYKHPSMEELFEHFYEGKVLHGPFFEHVLEYWEQSLERPDKMLFLKYEDLKDDPAFYVKKLAEFMGMPFTTQEENEGVIKQITEFCSISNMKELDCNKSGMFHSFIQKKSYFRKGEVGNWSRHFNPDMVKRMEGLMKQKFEGTGLSFKLRAN